jgi:hypothetical protein
MSIVMAALVALILVMVAATVEPVEMGMAAVVVRVDMQELAALVADRALTVRQVLAAAVEAAVTLVSVRFLHLAVALVKVVQAE